MKEQLTIEELQCYPMDENNGLEYLYLKKEDIVWSPNKTKDMVHKLRSISEMGYHSQSGTGHIMFYKEKFNSKPYLRILSSLTKEITHEGYNNGKPFVPIVELGKEFACNYHTDWYAVNQKLEKGFDIDLLPYEIIKILHKWHFWTGDQSYFEKGLIIDKSK